MMGVWNNPAQLAKNSAERIKRPLPESFPLRPLEEASRSEPKDSWSMGATVHASTNDEDEAKIRPWRQHVAPTSTLEVAIPEISEEEGEIEERPMPKSRKLMPFKPKANAASWLKKQHERMERRRAHFGTSEPSDEKDLKFLYGRENILKNFFEADVRRFVVGKDGLRQLASRVDQCTFVVQGRLVQVREGVKVPTFGCPNRCITR